MRSYAFAHSGPYPICILSPFINSSEARKAYLDPFNIGPEAVILHAVPTKDGAKKLTAAARYEFIETELLPELAKNETQYIVCTDAEYFKKLSGQPTADKFFGYVFPMPTGQFVTYAPHWSTIMYNPDKIKGRIAQTMQAIIDHAAGTYKDPGQGLLKFAAYPQTDEEIAGWLERLLEMDCDLACDIEAFSLRFDTSGIGTITFAWSKHEGIAFPIDYVPIDGATAAPYGRQVRNEHRRELLRNFFLKFKRRMLYHKASFDVTILLHHLFMDDVTDTEGLLHGLEVMLRDVDDTLLITYLATNSCAGNELGLKAQAQEFAGNYANSNIEDITKIPLDELLHYNLIDGCSTHYTYEKNFPIMVASEQQELYEKYFKAWMVDIVQMQLTGIPVDMAEVHRAHIKLQDACEDARRRIRESPITIEGERRLKEMEVEKRNAKLKKKRLTVADIDFTFNPGSSQQLIVLLHDVAGLPVLDKTATGQPSTEAATLKALRAHTTCPDTLQFLDALLDFAAVEIVLSTFIPALLKAVKGKDGWHYICGSLHLGGTVSGRLSSSDPNLQNMPSSRSPYAKIIKACFVAPPGWLYVTVDFLSLEDRISALTTKDPNKLKVYTDGFDGHCMRAYAYFPEQMPDIVDTLESINSIEEKYPELRSKSKAPTFALTYQGTWRTLVKKCGFSESTAKAIEQRFQTLYAASIEWVQKKLEKASEDGYVTLAFGLRLRTPFLAQTVRGTSKTPGAADAEGRTAGNALGQSWGMLNNRAGCEFMQQVRKSPYRLDIRPSTHIHDAQYYLVREDLGAIAYMNTHLINAVNWQEAPEIAHDEVHLGGSLEILYPNGASPIKIPNGANEIEIYDIVNAALEKRAVTH